MRELAFRTLQDGKVAESKDHIRRALRLEPESSDGYNILGMIRAAEDDLDAAATDFRRAASLAPGKAGPLLNLGRLLLTRGQYQSAAQVLEKALSITPDNAEAALLAGDARRQGGPSLLAKRHYRKALELQPQEPRAHAGLGEVLTNTGRFAEGRDHLLKAIESGDQTPRTRGYLGLAYALGIGSDEEAEQAVQHIEAARKAGDTGSHLVYGLGLAYVALRKYPEAERLLRDAIRRYPDVAGLHYTLADVYAATDRPELSKAARRKSGELTALRQQEEQLLAAIASRPRAVDAYLNYSTWLLRRGDARRAKSILAEAERIAPGHPGVLRELRLTSSARLK